MTVLAQHIQNIRNVLTVDFSTLQAKQFGHDWVY